MGTNIILEKSFQFSIRVIRTYQYLCKTKKEFVLSKQLLKSGTSIGANIKEAEHAQSKRDFLSKMNIALKEANETEYWIHLLIETDYFDKNGQNFLDDCIEIKKILHSIVKTAKNNIN